MLILLNLQLLWQVIHVTFKYFVQIITDNMIPFCPFKWVHVRSRTQKEPNILSLKLWFSIDSCIE